MTRIALGCASLINALEAHVLLMRIAQGKLALPVASWIPRPTSSTVSVQTWIAIVAAVALMIGCRAAVAATVLTVVNVVVLLWDQQAYSNHRLLATLLVAYLVFARSDTALSVEARRARAVSAVPWWPQLLMMTQLSVVYFFAAISKLNDEFLTGGVLRSSVRVSLPEVVYPVLAGATVLTELTLAFGLWLPLTRRVAVLLGTGLHAAIVVMLADQTMQLVSFALTCLAIYGLFLTRPAGGEVDIKSKLVSRLYIC